MKFKFGFVVIVFFSVIVWYLNQTTTDNLVEPTRFSNTQTLRVMPLSIADVSLEYLGAFRLPAGQIGASRVAYSSGALAVTPHDSFFMSGNNKLQGIAEFEIPKFNKAITVADLAIAKVKQPFVQFLNRNNIGNDQGLNHIVAMELIEDNLYVNVAEYYDADAKNTDTTFILDNPFKLVSSNVRSFFQFEGALHAAGWMSVLTGEWRDKLQASYISGYANNLPINSRQSIGPSAFISYLDNFAGISESNGVVPMTAVMDFSLSNPLHSDMLNELGNNKLWTVKSRAVYGFHIPDKDFYLVLGNSGGHESKIGYKIQTIQGNKCPGYCAYNELDYYNYYWLFDLNDFMQVKQGSTKPYQVRPIDYGKLELPFEHTLAKKSLLIGADFSLVKNELYLVLGEVDDLQVIHDVLPVVLVYRLN